MCTAMALQQAFVGDLIVTASILTVLQAVNIADTFTEMSAESFRQKQC